MPGVTSQRYAWRTAAQLIYTLQPAKLSTFCSQCSTIVLSDNSATKNNEDLNKVIAFCISFSVLDNMKRAG